MNRSALALALATPLVLSYRMLQPPAPVAQVTNPVPAPSTTNYIVWCSATVTRSADKYDVNGTDDGIRVTLSDLGRLAGYLNQHVLPCSGSGPVDAIDRFTEQVNGRVQPQFLVTDLDTGGSVQLAGVSHDSVPFRKVWIEEAGLYHFHVVSADSIRGSDGTEDPPYRNKMVAYARVGEDDESTYYVISAPIIPFQNPMPH